MLISKTLTIGFARRFAPYKRAYLIFKDIERLKRIFTNRDRPVQIIFSGKAHPRDQMGKDLNELPRSLLRGSSFEIRKMAKGMGINTYRMKKSEIIRAIQETEHNIVCFGTDRVKDCGEERCLWRDDCVRLIAGE